MSTSHMMLVVHVVRNVRNKFSCRPEDLQHTTIMVTGMDLMPGFHFAKNMVGSTSLFGKDDSSENWTLWFESLDGISPNLHKICILVTE